MTTYALWSTDIAGNPVDELELVEDGIGYSLGLNGSGSFGGARDEIGMVPARIPLGLYDVTCGSRELAILRDGACEFWGPITRLRRDDVARIVDITARERNWWLNARTMDDELVPLLTEATVTGGVPTWNARPIEIAKDLAEAAIAKTTEVGMGTYGGPLVNFTVQIVGTPSAAAHEWEYDPDLRYNVGQVINDLSGFGDDGFFYRMVYSGDENNLACVLQLGEGTALQTTTITVVPGSPTTGGMVGFTQDQDLEEAVNRLHGLGGPSGPVILQNDSSLTSGDFLLEREYVLPQAVPGMTIASYLQQVRRVKAPPQNIVEHSFVPGTDMPFADCQAGGLSEFHINTSGGINPAGPYDSAMIGQKAVRWQGGNELVTATHIEAF